MRDTSTQLGPFWPNASAIVLLKPVIRLGHTVIRNKNNKAGEHTHKKKERKKSRHFILMSARFYLHTMKMIYFLQGVRGADREEEKEEGWCVSPRRKEV